MGAPCLCRLPGAVVIAAVGSGGTARLAPALAYHFVGGQRLACGQASRVGRAAECWQQGRQQARQRQRRRAGRCPQAVGRQMHAGSSWLGGGCRYEPCQLPIRSVHQARFADAAGKVAAGAAAAAGSGRAACSRGSGSGWRAHRCRAGRSGRWSRRGAAPAGAPASRPRRPPASRGTPGCCLQGKQREQGRAGEAQAPARAGRVLASRPIGPSRPEARQGWKSRRAGGARTLQRGRAAARAGKHVRGGLCKPAAGRREEAGQASSRQAGGGLGMRQQARGAPWA